ncbi:uncharacterized protein RCH25_036104 [Pelodytes ibericus]
MCTSFLKNALYYMSEGIVSILKDLPKDTSQILFPPLTLSNLCQNRQYLSFWDCLMSQCTAGEQIDETNENSVGVELRTLKMAVIKPISFLVVLWTATLGESQNLIKNAKGQKLGSQLIISEVNADNPGADTAEYLELFHVGRQNISLDGYTLVFYNGKFNTAYKVLNLSGLSTDNRGFFLIGSLMVNPRPSIIVPSNTIQNGPDAIALYFGNGTYKENMKVTSDGLVDALVHKGKATDQPDILQTILTPGDEAFMEDPSYHISDESMGRCLEMDGQWRFRMTHISPGRENYCNGFPAVVISEVSSPYAQDLYVEIQGPPSTHLSGLVLAFVRGEDQKVYYMTEIKGYTNNQGFYLLENEKYSNRAQQTIPNSIRLFTKGGGAVALYLGKKMGITSNIRFPTSGLADAVVYGDYEDMGAHPLQDLTMGDPIIYWHSGDVNISASRCSVTTGDPAFFMLRGNSPGQTNDCPPESKPLFFTLCFQISDCTQWRGDQILTDFLAVLTQSLQAMCRCNLAPRDFTNANLSCQSNTLTFHAHQNATGQDIDLTAIQQEFATLGSSLTVRAMSALVLPSCLQPTDSPTSTADVLTDTDPAAVTPELLISEVNPSNPGTEDMEYVELYHPRNSSVSLAGYWLVFYNGKNNLAYYTLDLKDYWTDKRGYFLVGSSKVMPRPHVVMPFNTLQNGADAVALYHRPGKGYRKNMEVTADGLVDAVVYVSQVGDDAEGLLKVLTPGQEAVHENERFHDEDESLSRCLGLMPLSHSSYQVTKVTPLADNDCQALVPSPSPLVTSSYPLTSNLPMTLMISEVGVLTGSEPYDFIELNGPPGSRLHGQTLVLYDADGKVYDRFGLEGMVGMNGFYLISTDSASDQQLPSLSRPSTLSPEALALYNGSPESFPVGSRLTQKSLLDAVVYSWERVPTSFALRSLGKDSVTLYGDQRLVSVSSCGHSQDLSSPLMLPARMPSPGSANLCPSSVTHIQLDICISSSNPNCSQWQQAEQNLVDHLKITLSMSMEHNCSCGSHPAYIQDLQLKCTHGRLSISGNVLTSHNDQHLIQAWNQNLHTQPFILQDSYLGSLTGCLAQEKSQGSFKAWHVSILVLLSLLLICGVVVFLLYLRKRRPQNYTTIEMNAHRELISEY